MSAIRSTAAHPARPVRREVTRSLRALLEVAQSVQSARRFVLQRDQDATGVSGTGPVADGVIWPDGRATLCWRASAAGTVGAGSIGMYGSAEELLQVHGHGGRTRLVWID